MKYPANTVFKQEDMQLRARGRELLDREAQQRGKTSAALAVLEKRKAEAAKAADAFEITKMAVRYIQDSVAVVHDHTLAFLEKLVTVALKDVFGEEAYSFSIKSEYSERAVQVKFRLEREGEVFEGLECCGHGVIDVVCFALRVGILKLSGARPLLWIDEPFKNVSKEYILNVRELVQRLAKECQIQMVIITHVLPLVEGGAHVKIS